MSTSTINFGPGHPWGGVSQREYQRMAQDPRHQLAYRIHFAALGWADRHGHASFGPGKLAALLGVNPLEVWSPSYAASPTVRPVQYSRS
ncbi:hypothetical protein ACIQZO_24145 [Streptomyces sp. NPDC097617]|uniref:hypothetical protein n=1 Tax=Streptomyces sp. NPDC097617 TaxID=3366091 RepID=UPI0038039904